MITEAKRTGRHTWRGGVGRDRAQRAERLKQREEEPAKDTEKEHRGKEAGGRTRGAGAGEEAVSRSRKWSPRSDATERSGKVGP